MAELPVGSIERLIKDINTEDLRNNKETDNLLKVLKEKKLNLLIEKEKIKVVICCSIKDEDIGARIKEMLASLEIEGFVAHDGPDIPENVKKRVIDELNEFNAFIPILSGNFKNSDYCSQELGVAYFRNLLIIPLSLDGAMPYGFISGFQSPPVSENDIPLDHIIKLITDYFPKANISGKLINALKEANSPLSAENTMKNLEPYFDKLSDEEIKMVIDISIENNSITAVDLCKQEYLPKFIEINRDKIEKNKLREILEIIKENEEIKKPKADA